MSPLPDPEFYFDFPEPVSPSVEPDYCLGHCGACDEKHWSIEKAKKKETEGLVAHLRDELKLRNQDIEDLRLTNRNLSRKIVEDQKKRELMKGIHGS